MIKNLNSLAGRLKGIKLDGKELTVDDLKTIISSNEEKEIEVSELHMFTVDELGIRDKNLSDAEYAKGKVAGEEMNVKQKREELGLQFEGKTISNLLTAFEEKIKNDIGKKPDEKVKELEDKYNILKSTYETEKTDWSKKETNYTLELDRINKDTKLQAIMPDLTGVKKQHASMIFQSEHQIEDRDGSYIVKKNGEIIKDNLGNPVPLKDVFTSYAQDQKWISAEGRGGGNQSGGTSGFKDINEAMGYLKENNIDPSNPRWDEVLNSVAKE